MARLPEGAATRNLEEHGMGGMLVEQGLACLGRLLAGSTGQICVLPTDWKRWSALYPAYMAKPFLSELFSAPALSPSLTPSRPSSPELLDRLKTAPASMRLDRIRDFLQGIAAGLLGFPPGHSIDPIQPLNELGLDSLMSLELRNAVSAGIGQSLPATLLFNYPTIDDVANFLLKLLFAAAAEPAKEPQHSPGLGAQRNLLDNIENLSDEEVDRMLARGVGSNQ